MKKLCFVGLFVAGLCTTACQKYDGKQTSVNIRQLKGAWQVTSVDDGTSFTAFANNEGYIEGNGRQVKLLYVFSESEIAMGVIEKGQPAQWTKGKYKLDGKKIIGSNSKDVTVTNLNRDSLSLIEDGISMDMTRTTMPDFSGNKDAAPKNEKLARPLVRRMPIPQ